MNKEQIARVVHEANRAYCVAIGDNSQPVWEDAPDWQRSSTEASIEFALQNPDAPDSHQHDAWLADKVKDGWVYGPVKNPELKQHPCLVPYSELPIEQRLKDRLFMAIVKALSQP